MQVDVSQLREFRAPRVHAPNMASERGLPATRIVRVVKVIVTLRVRTECRVVAVRRQHQRSTAAPAADQLRGEQFPFCISASMRLEESIECTDARLIFAKAHKGAVATEYVRLRHRQRKACLTRVSKDELPSLDRLSLSWQRVDATALDRGLVDTVFVTQRIAVAGLRAEILHGQNADA